MSVSEQLSILLSRYFYMRAQRAIVCRSSALNSLVQRQNMDCMGLAGAVFPSSLQCSQQLIWSHTPTSPHRHYCLWIYELLQDETSDETDEETPQKARRKAVSESPQNGRNAEVSPTH